MKFKNVEDVRKWRFCVGCGACYFACRDSKIALINKVDQGIRPILNARDCGSCDRCLQVCPGYEVSQPIHGANDGNTGDFRYVNITRRLSFDK